MADCEANWLRANEPRDVARDPPLPVPVGVPDPPADRSLRRFDARRRSATSRSTTSAQRWADDGDWKWPRAPVERAWLPDLVPPTERLGDADRRRGRGDRAARRAAGHRRRGGQGLRGPRLRGARAGRRRACRTARPRPSTRPSTATSSRSARPAVPGRRCRARTRSRSRSTAATGWSSGSSASSATTRSRAAAERGVAPEVLFDELVRAVPAGSMGLILQPYWSPGVKIPGPEAKGAIIGFGDVHTRAHLYRAILEGLAYALREGAERTAKRTGVPLTSLRIAGGGSQSPSAIQLTADVFGLPVGARAHPRGVRARRGDRCRGRPGFAPRRADGGRGDGPRRRGPRPGPRHACALRRAVSRRLQPDVPAAPAALPARSGGSRAIRRPERWRYARPKSALMPG